MLNKCLFCIYSSRPFISDVVTFYKIKRKFSYFMRWSDIKLCSYPFYSSPSSLNLPVPWGKYQIAHRTKKKIGFQSRCDIIHQAHLHQRGLDIQKADVHLPPRTGPLCHVKTTGMFSQIQNHEWDGERSGVHWGGED